MAMTRVNKSASVESQLSEESTMVQSPSSSVGGSESGNNSYQTTANKIQNYAPKWFKNAFK